MDAEQETIARIPASSLGFTGNAINQARRTINNCWRAWRKARWMIRIKEVKKLSTLIWKRKEVWELDFVLTGYCLMTSIYIFKMEVIEWLISDTATIGWATSDSSLVIMQTRRSIFGGLKNNFAVIIWTVEDSKINKDTSVD